MELENLERNEERDLSYYTITVIAFALVIVGNSHDVMTNNMLNIVIDSDIVTLILLVFIKA